MVLLRGNDRKYTSIMTYNNVRLVPNKRLQSIGILNKKRKPLINDKQKYASNLTNISILYQNISVTKFSFKGFNLNIYL